MQPPLAVTLLSLRTARASNSGSCRLVDGANKSGMTTRTTMGNPVVVALAETQKPLQRTVSTKSHSRKSLKALPLERMATLQ